MKKILMATLALLTLQAQAANDNDTIKVSHPDKVTIITGDSLQKVIISGREGDPDFSYRSTIQLVDTNYVSNTVIGRERWDIRNGISVNRSNKDEDKDKKKPGVEVIMHVGLGFNNPTNVDDGISFKTFRSGEIIWNIFEVRHMLNKKGTDYLSWGFGLGWRNYRMTGNRLFEKDANGHIVTGSYPDGASKEYSRINTFALNLPLLYGHNFKHHWGFSVGPVINWNTYGSIFTHYRQGGGTHEYKTKHIHQRPFTVDLMAVIRNPFIPFYVKYSPMDVMKSGMGPKFKSLSFGLYF